MESSTQEKGLVSFLGFSDLRFVRLERREKQPNQLYIEVTDENVTPFSIRFKHLVFHSGIFHYSPHFFTLQEIFEQTVEGDKEKFNGANAYEIRPFKLLDRGNPLVAYPTILYKIPEEAYKKAMLIINRQFHEELKERSLY